MKAKKFLFLLLSFLLSSCSSEDVISFTFDSSVVKVIFEENDAFTMDKRIYEVKKGEDLTVFLDFKQGYTFKDINYAANRYEVNEDLDVTLTLFQISYPLRLKVESEESGVILSYHLNGGRFLNQEEGEHFICIDSLKHHLRPNVSIGTDRIYRDGYIQVGWNTKPDGTGTHVGLGSRITIRQGKIDLYAEWEKYTKPSFFLFKENESKELTITSYTGPLKGEKLCIPSTIGDKKVTQLGKNVFWNIQFDWVILPQSLKKIDSSCFAEFEIKKLTFFDNLKEVDDESFSFQSIPCIDIQACLAPRFIADNDNSRFSENIDNLIVNKGSKKMVFFAGCSMSYGLKSEIVQEQFKDYQIINCGVIGGICATMQLDIIASFLEKGDIFIHAPEEMSGYQLLHDYDFAMKCFMIVESNYDLLHYTNLSLNTKIFSSFRDYNDLRYKLVSQSYSQYNSNYNDFGDICIERRDSPFDSYFDLEECFSLSSLDDKTASNLNRYYSYLEKRGVRCFLSYAPLNLNAIKKVEGAYSAKNTYEDFMKTYLKKNLISKLDDYIFNGNYFYDKDYHLNDNGAKIRTKKLIEDIEKGMLRYGNQDNL